MVVKPVIGANAAGAFRLRRETWRRDAEAIERYFATRAALVQPFVDAIVTEGEYSLFYFERELSHAVIKAPAPSDFRVQEEHGASIQTVAVTDELRAVGDLAMRAVPGAPLYARVDLVRANGGDGYWVMELELIEPSLYLRMDTAAPGRFANAFARSVRHDGTRGQVTQA
jgi:glutathione synthase/RimK-type ligase-like ATP-grasp enzyme